MFNFTKIKQIKKVVFRLIYVIPQITNPEWSHQHQMDLNFQASVDSTEFLLRLFQSFQLVKCVNLLDFLKKIIVNCSSDLNKPTNSQTPEMFNMFLKI